MQRDFAELHLKRLPKAQWRRRSKMGCDQSFLSVKFGGDLKEGWYFAQSIKKKQNITNWSSYQLFVAIAPDVLGHPKFRWKRLFFIPMFSDKFHVHNFSRILRRIPVCEIYLCIGIIPIFQIHMQWNPVVIAPLNIHTCLLSTSSCCPVRLSSSLNASVNLTFS